MRSRALVLVVSLGQALAGTALAQGDDAPPTSPSGLTARAYGTSSGGIAWCRSSDDRGVRGYEVSRDGELLGVFDTLSYVDGDLFVRYAAPFQRRRRRYRWTAIMAGYGATHDAGCTAASTDGAQSQHPLTHGRGSCLATFRYCRCALRSTSRRRGGDHYGWHELYRQKPQAWADVHLCGRCHRSIRQTFRSVERGLEYAACRDAASSRAIGDRCRLSRRVAEADLRHLNR